MSELDPTTVPTPVTDPDTDAVAPAADAAEPEGAGTTETVANAGQLTGGDLPTEARPAEEDSAVDDVETGGEGGGGY